MKKLLLLLLTLSFVIAMTACGPEEGEPLVSNDGSVTGVPDDIAPVDSSDLLTEPAVSTDNTSDTSADTSAAEPTESVTEPAEPAVTEPTSSEPPATKTDPTTASKKTTEPTTKTEATTPKATEPSATTPAPDDDDEFEELEDEIINIDEYWALLGIEDDDSNANVEP